MTALDDVRNRRTVRLMWIGAFTVLCAGLVATERQYGEAAARSQARSEVLYQRILANESIIAQSGRLKAAQKRALSDLRRVSGEITTPRSTAALIDSLGRSAKMYGVRLTSLSPAQTGSGPNPQTELTGIPIALKVEGRFANLLRFVADISRHAPPISVTGTAFTPAHNSFKTTGRDPVLEATVSATFFQVRIPAANRHV